MNPCPPAEVLGRLLVGPLPESDWAGLEAHVETCATCQDSLARLVGDLPGRLCPAPSPDPGRSWPDPAFLARLTRSIGALPGSSPVAPEAADSPDAPDASAASGPLQAEDRSAGHPWPALAGYEILAELGRGGMGVVYKARHLALDRLVAVKTLLGQDQAGPQQRAAFRKEAEALARLQHPHIVQIFEVGEQACGPYFAMELIEGPSLDRQLRAGPLAPDQAAALVETLARTVDYAHQHGIVHRDIKPSNILLASGPDGLHHAKVTDFSLARRLDRTVSLTGGGFVAGTPSYMAPEQVAGGARAIGPLIDVYALGAVLYECLTGQPPFVGQTPLDILIQVLSDEPVAPVHLRPGVPRDLQAVALTCLRKDPSERYASAGRLADDLRLFLNGCPVRTRPLGALPRLVRWCRRRPVLAALGLVIAVLVLIQGVGATYSAVRHWQQRQHALALLARAQDAEERLTQELGRSHLEQGRAGHLSRRMGQRHASLQALARAAALAPSLEIRNEAVHCLALTDLRELRRWNGAPLGTTLVAFDAQLQRYARARVYGDISIRRVEDDAELVRLADADMAKGTTALFSPDGRYLAVDGSRDWVRLLRVWDLERREVLIELDHHIDHTVLEFNFSPDSRRLAAARQDGVVVVWELPSGREERLLRVGPDLANLAVHPGGRQIAVCSHLPPAPVRVYDLDSGAELARLEHPAGVHAVAWSSDGRLLAAGCHDLQACVWDMDRRRLLTNLDGHLSDVKRLTFDPGGRRLLTRSYDGWTRWWDPVTGHLVLSLRAGYHRFGPDGRLAFGEGPFLGVWEVTPEREFRTLPHGLVGNHYPVPPAKSPMAVSYSPDGRWLASGGDGVHLFDAVSGREVAVVPAGPVRSVQFDPAGGTRLLTCGEGGLNIWPLRVRGAGETARLEVDAPHALEVGPSHDAAAAAHPHLVRAAWGQGGRRIAVADRERGRVVLLDPDGRNQDGRAWDFERVLRAALSPDGRWVAAASDSPPAARVWDTGTGQAVRDFPGARGPIVFSPDGHWVITDTGTDCTLWPVEAWTAPPALRLTRRGNPPLIGSVAFSPDSRTIAFAVTSDEVMLVETATGRELATLIAPVPQLLTALVFSPDGLHLAAATENHVVQLWDLGRLRTELAALGLDWPDPAPAFASPGPNRPGLPPAASGGFTLRTYAGCCSAPGRRWVNRVAFLPGDPRKAVYTQGTCVVLLDLATGAAVPHDLGGRGNTWGLSIAPDGSHAYFGRNREPDVPVLDLATGRRRHTLAGHPEGVWSVACSPDGRRAVSGGPNGLVLWDAATGRKTREFPGVTDKVRCVAFSPDGRWLASGHFAGDARHPDQGTVLLWDLESNTPARQLRGHACAITALAFTPDARQLLSASFDETVRVWDIASGRLATLFEGHSAGVENVLVCPDGRHALSAGRDHAVRLWNLKTGQEALCLTGHTDCVTGLALSPDGRQVLTCGHDGDLRLWQLPDSPPPR